MKKQQGFWRKAIANAVIYTLVFAQIAPSVQAASIDISDIPLVVKNTVAPNIMFTLDDSGSMQWEFLPEEQMQYSAFLFPLPAGAYGANDYGRQAPTFEDNNVHNYYGRSSSNNTQFYNPDIDYKPWSNADASLMADANPRAALYNPMIPAAGSIDLLATKTENAVWFNGGGAPTEIMLIARRATATIPTGRSLTTTK